MPVLIKDFVWRQTKNVVIIHVPLKGIHYSKVDIFTSDDYIKANFIPFLFEVFLSARVKESESKCTLSEGEIILELVKVVPGHWDHLDADLTKQEMKDIRAVNVERAQIKAQADKKTQKDKMRELERLAIRKQIHQDTIKLDTIKQIKNNEKDCAMEELEIWKAKQAIEQNLQLKESSALDRTFPKKTEFVSKHKRECKQKIKAKKTAPGQCTITEIVDLPKKKIETPMPLPRSMALIQVNFTPRVFPTPSRESQKVEEEEWLKTQYEARRNVGFVAEDLTPDEQDPLWLKDKGDSFFKLNNYLGAVSAYSHAIKIGSKMPALYSNRAAAHMALGNLHKVVEDCSQALELLVPCIDLNADSRLKCHVRRATALCRLGLKKHGIADLQAALKLNPNNEQLKADLKRAENLADSSSGESD